MNKEYLKSLIDTVSAIEVKSEAQQIAKYELIEHVEQLQAKYNKVLTMLVNHYPPCEIDGFMDKNIEYCSINCGVDEEIFKECWDRYITQSLEGNNE